MWLEPGDEQQALVDAVRSVLDDVATPASVRARADGGSFDRAAWTTLGELGVFGIGVAEADGGLGLGMVELALVLESVGRSALSAPVLETAVVVAPLLAATSDDRRGLLDGVVGGDLVATATLSSGSTLATDAQDADMIATLGPTVRLDRPSRFRVRPQQSMASGRGVCVVEPSTEAQEVVGPTADDLLPRILVANSALLLGNAAALVERTLDYVAERRQFDRPIASFQAVKHRLADAHVELEASRAAVWAAAVDLDEGPATQARAAAHTAAAIVGEAAEFANDMALQLHGGIGYTWEYDLQLWLKQGIVLGRRLGRPARHRRRALELRVASIAGSTGTATAVGSRPSADTTEVTP
ncbi:MAG: acyl-CoA dehydrogenase family protein [Ilumatobacter sp.]|uniref:acyl-CoA dehydrogenase family protein n=1 Tax=Ilumatobacter sp. TaxID=1967498 RepID=UPI00391A0975